MEPKTRYYRVRHHSVEYVDQDGVSYTKDEIKHHYYKKIKTLKNENFNEQKQVRENRTIHKVYIGGIQTKLDL